MSSTTRSTAAAFNVGDRVRAKIDMLDDLRDDGMGISLCASKGEELIVRSIRVYPDKVYLHVSHEHITDRSFSVTPDEIDLVASTQQQQERSDV